MITKYGFEFPDGTPEIQMHLSIIQMGRDWCKSHNVSLFDHHKQLQSLLYPHKKWHKWNLMLLEQFCEHDYIGILGPASSGKTHEAVCYALDCYFASPNNTAVLVSSTTRDALELRAWGEIKKYWGIARLNYEPTPGNIIGSKQRISTDDEDVEDRDFRKGVSCVACKVGTTWVGLGPFVGIKQQNVILVADEASLMSPAFLEAVSNLSKNPSFTCIAMGNPKDRTDPLGVLTEPHEDDGGWEGLEEKLETRMWRTRYPNGLGIQLCGLDGPNMGVAPGQPVPYPFLITQKTIDADVALYGQDSIKVTMMDYGVMPKASASRRIITRSLCHKFHAFEDVIWNTPDITKIFGLDAAYGAVGGDRCVACEVNFGRDTSGNMILAYIGDPIIVPVSVRKTEEPTDQIALFVKAECERRNIPPENVYFDSTGRGELALAFARRWSAAVNGVEFGGAPTERAAGPNANKTCKDEFDRFLSELWWATRWIVESGQMRQLPEAVAQEGFMKQWEERFAGGRVKIRVETKDETRERLGRSSDLYDAFVVAVEGCRRRGFQIAGLSANKPGQRKVSRLEVYSQQYRKLLRAKELQAG